MSVAHPREKYEQRHCDDRRTVEKHKADFKSQAGNPPGEGKAGTHCGGPDTGGPANSDCAARFRAPEHNRRSKKNPAPEVRQARGEVSRAARYGGGRGARCQATDGQNKVVPGATSNLSAKSTPNPGDRSPQGNSFARCVDERDRKGRADERQKKLENHERRTPIQKQKLQHLSSSSVFASDERAGKHYVPTSSIAAIRFVLCEPLQLHASKRGASFRSALARERTVVSKIGVTH
jgi:hypothetical protein